jgi:eukaryotic-like serine/threonine-protein kinase
MANKFVNSILQAKWWVKLLLAIVLIVLFLVMVNWVLKAITHHGESLPVPKVKGLVFEEATQLLDEQDLRYVVFDSVYVPKAKPNQIVEQNPSAGSKVKRNRIIYLTINALPVPKVKVPSVIDMSLREAVSKLQAAGLEVGEITTKPDLTINWVLEQRMNGRAVKAGTEVDKGSKVDLVVSKGENSEDKDLTMLDIRGLTLDEATIELTLVGLNIGTVTYDESVSNKAQAVIYKQIPQSGSEVYMGKEIDIFLKEAD